MAPSFEQGGEADTGTSVGSALTLAIINTNIGDTVVVFIDIGTSVGSVNMFVTDTAGNGYHKYADVVNTVRTAVFVGFITSNPVNITVTGEVTGPGPPNQGGWYMDMHVEVYTPGFGSAAGHSATGSGSTMTLKYSEGVGSWAVGNVAQAALSAVINPNTPVNPNLVDRGSGGAGKAGQPNPISSDALDDEGTASGGTADLEWISTAAGAWAALGVELIRGSVLRNLVIAKLTGQAQLRAKAQAIIG